jgi:serine protease Do
MNYNYGDGGHHDDELGAPTPANPEPPLGEYNADSDVSAAPSSSFTEPDKQRPWWEEQSIESTAAPGTSGSEPSSAVSSEPEYSGSEQIPEPKQPREDGYGDYDTHEPSVGYRVPRYSEVPPPETPYTPGITFTPSNRAGQSTPPSSDLSGLNPQNQLYSQAPQFSDPQAWNSERQAQRSRNSSDKRASSEKKRGGFFRTICLLLVCAVVGAGAGIGGTYYAAKNGYLTVPRNTVVLGAPTPAVVTPGEYSSAPLVAGEEELSAEQIYYSIASNQVVSISSSVTTSSYFGSQSSTYYGSGFIISEDGYILTNYHVISDAQQAGATINVTVRSGEVYTAKVVGFEEDNDVAVIKIDAIGLSPAKIGSSANLRVGERIYAVGNPSRLDYTMTDGIVSALNRTIQVESNASINMFQISAAVNRGNSGGPVYNTRGEVVGIVSAKYISEGTEGLGFAIPMDDAMRIATELISNGYVSGKAKLGITGRDLDAQTAEYYGWPVGIVVRSVEAGSAADRAGIQVGDTIIAMGDKDVTTIDALNAEKKNFKAGDKTTITVVRSGETLTLNVTFDEDLSAG